MPFGYLEFSRAIGRELCPHMRACARAPPLAATAAAAGPGAGSGPGPGPGSGSLPGLVLFESGLRVWVASIPLRYPNRTRSATRTGPAPLSGSEPTRSKTVGLPTVATVGCVSWAANSCDCWVERLQPFVGFGPVGPSWSAIYSTPNSQLKDTPTPNEISLPLSSSFRTGTAVLHSVLEVKFFFVQYWK